jgi:hypothetical protein
VLGIFESRSGSLSRQALLPCWRMHPAPRRPTPRSTSAPFSASSLPSAPYSAWSITSSLNPPALLRLPRQCVCWHLTVLRSSFCFAGRHCRDGVDANLQILEGVGILGRPWRSPDFCGSIDEGVGTSKRGD